MEYWQSNALVNEADPAFVQRMLLIPFNELNVAPVSESSANLYSSWLMIRELLSSLMMDFSTLLWNGHLDSEAIRDCAAFLQAVIGRKRDRNLNL